MSCLLIIDIQNDFLDNGPFALTGSRAIIPNINAQLSRTWDLVVASRDWHPQNHISFAATQNKPEYTPVVLSDGENTINSLAWPTHCIADTLGAQFDPLLDQKNINVVVDKGTDPNRECFSAFRDVFGKHTQLKTILRNHGIHTVYVCGVVTEYCVLHTALDAVDLGFKTILLEDCVFAITAAGGQSSQKKMMAAGVQIELGTEK